MGAKREFTVIKFTIDAPPGSEQRRWLDEAAAMIRESYNAMLEAFELRFRRELVDEAQSCRTRWLVWANAPDGTRGERPRRWTFPTPVAGDGGRHNEVFSSLYHVGRHPHSEALSACVTKAMAHSDFTRDLNTYVEKRVADRENASIGHRARALPIHLDHYSNACFMIEHDAENNEWFAVLPMWGRALGADAAWRNQTPFRIIPKDRRYPRAQRMWKHVAVQMEDALAREATGSKTYTSCSLIPPNLQKGRYRWELHVRLLVPAREVKELPTRYAGVDLGVNHAAVWSCPEAETFQFFDCPELVARFNRRRESGRGVPKSRRWKSGQRLGRQREYFMRVLARRVADLCSKHEVTDLRVEDLSGIRNGDRDPDHNWVLGALFPFFTMRSYIEQACEKVGVRVSMVDPAGTSQTCSKCGHRDPASRQGKRFICTRCGYQADADLNAANNIAANGKATSPRKGRGNTPPSGSIPADAADNTAETQQAVATAEARDAA